MVEEKETKEKQDIKQYNLHTMEARSLWFIEAREVGKKLYTRTFSKIF